MSLPVIIEPEAQANLRQALEWWYGNRSQEQALRWYDGIHDAIGALAHNPQRCPLARENHKSDDELRESHFGLQTRPTHRIIFVIDPDAVRVLAIRHVAQDDAAREHR